MYFNYGIKEINYLKQKDKKLGAIIDSYGILKREVEPNLFEFIIRSIIAQQISTSAVFTIFNRLVEKIGVINDINIINLSDDELKSIGISFRKVSYIKNFAYKVYNKEIDLESLKYLSDKEVIFILSSLKGIGIWTAQMVMLFSMQRLNILSYDDFGIRKGLKIIYNKEIDKDSFEKYKKRYSPYGSIASFYIWEAANNEVFSSFYNFEFGILKISYFNNVVTFLKVVDSIDAVNKKSKFSDLVFSQILQYFKGTRTTFDFKYKLEGTQFQMKVWTSLLKIEYGKTISYKELAIMIGNVNACRAVGMANNKNPITIVVPCHRVIGSNKKMVGYASGIKMKQSMLDLEEKVYEDKCVSGE